MKNLFLTAAAIITLSSVVQAQVSESSLDNPTYPCTEFLFASSCAKFPYMSPQEEKVTTGLEIKCEVTSKHFSSVSTQRQALQQNCVYGECTPIGYGFIWYLTRRVLSSKDSPRVFLSTTDFVLDSSPLDTQEITVSFNSSQSFFDYSRESSEGINTLNGETLRMNSQKFNVRMRELMTGIQRPLKVGVLGTDRSIHYVDAVISCSANP